MFSFQAKAKWEAWLKNEGKSKEEAMVLYIKAVKDLLIKYGLPLEAEKV